ncbi:hypothetical protein [Actinoplanes sp. NBRC 101535]|uniref:hypothetical protein n=1 Tax=Actinoplanes sp. NBRC 101535 TaxID=3032196 RepID=UPI0024A07CC8|nr:hypothetical protein [Actinoplanes sp. NBRC 101535]GLY06433.1 hypothetical protein Acsp01_68120 [Actinoplanes sp. NBRC 101535]
MAAVARRDVSGVLTAPVVFIPYWLWARRELARHDVPERDAATVAVAVAGPAVLMSIHALMNRSLRG